MNKKGFTLIEMLIVIAIIAILAGAVIVGLGPVQKQGRDARRIADLREVQTGLELFFNKCGFYPGTVSCGSGIPETYNSPSNWSTLQSTLSGSSIGISTVPVDPINSGSFYYRYASSNTPPNSYVLGAQLEDSGNPVLNNSISGNVYGINCGNPVYCVEL